MQYREIYSLDFCWQAANAENIVRDHNACKSPVRNWDHETTQRLLNHNPLFDGMFQEDLERKNLTDSLVQLYATAIPLKVIYYKENGDQWIYTEPLNTIDNNTRG